MDIKNNLRTSLRHLKADKTNTSISISGLILGLGIVAVILVYILNELSYNSSFANEDRIYRVVNYSKNDNNTWATSPFTIGEAAKNELPGIESFIHQYNIGNIEVKRGNVFIHEPEIMCCESDFFNAFGVKILQGSLTHFDETSGKIALSHKLAKKYFGNDNPVGQQLDVRYNGKESSMEVAAVFADIPNNSTIKAALISNINFGLGHLSDNLISGGIRPSADQIRQAWDYSLLTNYLLLKKEVDKNVLEAKLKQLGEKNEKENLPLSLSLQPLSDIYFGSGQIVNSGSEKGNKPMLILFGVIGLLILFIATINYLNLASVKTMAQVKSLAVRKVCGAGKSSIISQIVSESTITIIIALPFAVLVAWFAMPLISQMLGKGYAIEMTSQMTLSIIVLALLSLGTGILAGMLVSVRASRFSLVNILKGNKSGSSDKHYARKAMVIFQFTVFIVLIAVTFLVQKQVRYAFNKDLGFAKEGLISVPLGDHNLELYKQEIEKNPNILSASGTIWMPPSDNKIYLSLPKVSNPDEKVNVNALFVDYDFAKTMGLKIIMGSDLSKEKNSSGVLINESAIKALGLTSILGEQTAWGKVEGVVNDFNMLSLHEAITPTIIKLNPSMSKNIAIRLRTENLPETIAFLKQTWENTGGTTAFNVEFTNDILEGLYTSEIRFSKTIGLLAVIAIVIASLGLFGLSLLMSKQRIKEIGIRKVNGAKITEVMVLLNQDFIKWVVIAFIVATPVAYYAMNKWLENFAYKTALSWWIFVVAGLLALGIALLTVSWQSWRTATRNPVESLRYE